MNYKIVLDRTFEKEVKQIKITNQTMVFNQFQDMMPKMKMGFQIIFIQSLKIL